ncbi:MAG: hypothetical protein ACYTBJ_11985 [Planctomycetota bacterium]|jgi:hypothetical protein
MPKYRSISISLSVTAGIFAVWLGIVAVLASALHKWEMKSFDFSAGGGWAIGFTLLATITGVPLLVAGVFSIERIPTWAKCLITVLTLIIALVVALIAALLYLAIHIPL